MTQARIVSAVLGVCVCLPIWFYVLFQILTAIQATELTWFLFWVYVPVSMLTLALAKLTERP